MSNVVQKTGMDLGQATQILDIEISQSYTRVVPGFEVRKWGRRRESPTFFRKLVLLAGAERVSI